ncbi:putative ABC transport system permease protein [Nitrospirillum amazonense]|uniref:Putative ABC transport system permease protein n=1 Tax=Nitrospirillum amazonense TaxID=28077 RepID=A0A560EU50_9PROT|nr:ABC transporter permease [Nitrospirillum amazonense]TWB12909.1 putative ABC transport system permease protein [Nitrospirillum amazonense]
MFGNFLKVAVRVLVRQRLYTALNIAGLALGMATAAMIGLFVWHEMHYDGFFSHADRIHRLIRTYHTPSGAAVTVAAQSKPLGPALARDFPEAEAVVRVVNHAVAVRRDSAVFEVRLTLADADYFRLFDWPFLAGDPATAISQPGTVVLTERTARKLFSSVDILGRAVTLTSGVTLTVAGVIRDLPSNTVFHMEMLANIATRLNDGWDEPFAAADTQWHHSFLRTYLLLKSGVEPASLVARFPGFLAARMTEYLDTATGKPSVTLDLQPLTRVHVEGISDDGVPLSLLVTFLGVGALVLGIAVINFINLSTARSSLRAREVAIRKTLGGRRGVLVAQFLTESVLLSFISGALALVLVELAMPRFLALLDLRMDAHFMSGLWIAAISLPLVAVVGLLGGLYPALVLSRPRPGDLLKGGPMAAGGGRLRAILVVAQFAAAIVLGISTVVMLQQTRYASTQRLGFMPENVVLLRGLDTPAGHAHQQALREALLRIPGVIAAGGSLWTPGDGADRFSSYRLPDTPKEKELQLRTEGVDFGYMEAVGMKVLAGRLFDQAHPQDGQVTRPDAPEDEEAPQGDSIVLSALAVTRLGLGTPEQALGRTVIYGDHTAVTVIGVVDDVQFDSAKSVLEPTLYLIEPRFMDVMAVRVAAGGGAGTLAAIDDTWRRLYPDLPLKREFLDDHIRDTYAATAHQGQLLGLFSGLAILIACLGLFGLAAFTAERRTKEIGLRKVLGATVPDIVRLLVWQFSKPVVVATLVAWPVAWVLAGRWLGEFVYRVDLDPLVFVIAGLVALLIAWVTVAGHAARVAAAKPVRALRYE